MKLAVATAAVVVAALLLAWNAVGLAQTLLWLIRYGGGGDWVILATTLGLWSPPATWIWAVLVVPLGLPTWQALHLVGLAMIRDWRVIGVALLSWAFWQDVANGNILTFVLLAAWWAIRGNILGEIGFLALAVLIPRPLMIPVLAWLLVNRPRTRWWFAALVVAVLATSLLSGQAGDWIARVSGTLDEHFFSEWNIGPSRLLGALWIPLAVVSSAVLFWRGWLGLASVVIMPWLYPYYLLLALLDLPRMLEHAPELLARARSLAPSRLRPSSGAP